jgi:DNA-binding NarL/FixJ family response regulator
MNSLQKTHSQKARRIIFSQEMIPLSIKRTALFLFEHELEREQPRTENEALSNTLKWMRIMKHRQEAGLLQLTPMQKKIIELLVYEGLTQKQIALRLERDPNTIKHHCTRIRKKVGVDSMYQVVAVAVDLGWVTAPQVQERNGNVG